MTTRRAADPVTAAVGRELRAIAAVLLVLQAGISGLSVLGYAALAAYDRLPLTGGRAWPLLPPLLWLLLGLAVPSGRVWARRLAVACEGLAVLLYLLERLLPGAQLTPITLLSALVLPVAVRALLTRAAVRTAPLA